MHKSVSLLSAATALLFFIILKSCQPDEDRAHAPTVAIAAEPPVSEPSNSRELIIGCFEMEDCQAYACQWRKKAASISHGSSFA